MKKLLIVMLAFGLMGALIIAPPAGAAVLNDLTPVISPDGLAMPPYVDLQAGGNLYLGGGPYGSWIEPQEPGLFGVGASLSSLGTAIGYNVYFDTALNSFDIADFDQFIVAITQGAHYWDAGTVVDTWTWGGTTLDDILEFENLMYGLQMPVTVSSGSDYYLFVGLVNDFIYPSWGMFSDVTIEAVMEPGPGPEPTVPEPAVIILLGLGVIGLAGLRRKL